MSRIGKLPIDIPAGVEVKIGEGNHITVKGPKGTLERKLADDMNIAMENGQITVTRPSDLKRHRALHGLTRTLIFTLGYSHPVEMIDPEGIETVLEGQNKITVKGIDKEKVGQFAAEIRTKRPPEPYKGKGIKYADEHIRRKVGKTGKK